VDVGAARWAAVDALDELKHLAKVRVASSIPVFRSKMAGQGSIFNPMSPPLTRTPRIRLKSPSLASKCR